MTKVIETEPAFRNALQSPIQRKLLRPGIFRSRFTRVVQFEEQNREENSMQLQNDYFAAIAA
jgi:hypothetical protein